ncbi:alpha/beta fold hydrolase BchO [Blastochloris viridis]|uniref:Alpha/beta hydrolase fold n=1 Tax=Blastochloris viridis TaxID=1079 RepID=A0A0H5BNW3_BLAVI|nr:alpha/beta fold hydrolase BchO [Blastochloris viridis]ALK08389.1 Soluble epoxide hydrolase [Blastochloris viridis]BAR98338.1 alpha/beta hydrolase fold [Blastochloris viridis]CUU41051.1 Soluble epoxide hydrolase [Blastochloris viridis]
MSRLEWQRDGLDWPNRHASHFIQAAGFRWHVQKMGEGPALLLVHGTGAATHSWGGLLPLLAKHFTVVAPDLPGHGFSELPRTSRLSIPGMAHAMAELLQVMDFKPAICVGHSAGVAAVARMTLDRLIDPRLIIGINAAVMPFRGLAGQVLIPVAQMFFRNPLMAYIYAWSADPEKVEKVIVSTGSNIDAKSLELYARLFQNSGHVAGALGMMARWNLAPLVRELPKLSTPITLVVGCNDRTVQPDEAVEVAATMWPQAKVIPLKGLGHLAHEERPPEVADVIIQEARLAGILGA